MGATTMLKKYSTTVSLILALAAIASLAIAANLRNRVFKTPVTLWADAASKSPTKRRTHENYGQALSTAGILNEALRQFQTVQALPDDGSVPPRDLYREIGVVYFRMGLIDDAITAWQTGLRYAPFDPSILNNLGVAYIRKGSYDEAETVVRQALQISPSMPHLLNTLGEILMVKGQYQDAVNSFLAAIRVGPDTPARWWNAALAFEKIGKYDKAYEYASRYAAMEPSPALRQQARNYLSRLQALYLSKRNP